MTKTTVPAICAYCEEYTRKHRAGYCILRKIKTFYTDTACAIFLDGITGEKHPSYKPEPEPETEPEPHIEREK